MESRLLKTILYFDVFSYPLLVEEILKYNGIQHGESEQAEKILHSLNLRGFLNFNRGYYFIDPDFSIVENRIKGNLRAQKRLGVARRYSKIISFFPFVRGIFLSGSLSKGCISEIDDIDYFIITSPGRLWITRSLLVLFRRVFLLNSHKNFCVNYFIDAENLSVRRQNRFTATEIAFLLPMYNLPLHSELIKANNWIKNYYPTFQQNGEWVIANTSVIKKMMEKILDNKMGEYFDNCLYKYSKRFIERKFGYLGEEIFSRNFCLRKNEVQYFPKQNGTGIMERYYKRVRLFKKLYGTSNLFILTPLLKMAMISVL